MQADLILHFSFFIYIYHFFYYLFLSFSFSFWFTCLVHRFFLLCVFGQTLTNAQFHTNVYRYVKYIAQSCCESVMDILFLRDCIWTQFMLITARFLLLLLLLLLTLCFCGRTATSTFHPRTGRTSTSTSLPTTPRTASGATSPCLPPPAFSSRATATPSCWT